MSVPSTTTGRHPTQTRRGGSGPRPLRLLLGTVGMVVVAYVVVNAFLAFALFPQWFFRSGILIGILGLAVGILGSILFFRFLNMAIEGLPSRMSEGLIPYAFLLPGLALLGLMLVYPAVQTVVYSFANRDSTAWVGLANYRAIFSSADFWQALLNNFLWILIVPAVTVAFGLAVAVLADKLSSTGERITKSTIFLPMAISFVGASTIWGLVYAYNAPGTAQVGLLNAIWTSLGGEPQAWLQISTGRLNSLLLMVILVWLQTGFAMVLLSSAIKAVPEDTIEAGRMDGASEARIFWQIVFPQVRTTLLAVFITVLILVLKVFDIIYVMTNGRDQTDVIANLFFRRLFVDANAGQSSAIVVVLLVLIIPVLIYQVRAFRAQEANR
ncbi:sugar ABC transporter permease [Brachybacterium sp. EF45031]|uniref:carbohydrate ABC transporter permease n=1 Tax=Brachybacterium sillae TaxID=2810536 RepID=UPI00217CC96B|nr:sugar ABC transporter permease [Brachybacterium sillae]MCS6712140.1 sugar ABC transporter permease [Brachybacterium sillae]